MTSYVSALGRRVKENELRLLLGVQARQMKGKKDVLLPFRGGKAGGPCGHKECQPSTLSSRSSGLSEKNDARMSATTALIRGSGSSARANVAAPAIEPRMVMRKMCPALNIGWCQ